MSSGGTSSRSVGADQPLAEQARVLEAFRHLREDPNFRTFLEVLHVRRVAEGERRVNDMIRGSGARGDNTPTVNDLGQWARELSYWRGMADGLYYAATIVDKTVMEENQQG